MKRFITLLVCVLTTFSASAIEVFPWDEMSTQWQWRANTGLLKSTKGAVLQPSPSPRKMAVNLKFPHGGTSLICSGDGQKMTLGAVPIGEESWTWKGLGKKGLSSDEVNVLLNKKQTDLPRWAGTIKNQEGVSVSYRIIYVNSKLLFGLMTGKRDGLVFTRTFTMTR